MEIVLFILLLLGQCHNDLVKAQRYDEAITISKYCKWSPSFFFYRAIAEFKVKNYKEADRLADQALQYNNIPERYSEVLLRLKEEIKREKTKLDDISTDMQLVKERLETGKGGIRTQEVQKRIIKKLDEEIAKIEEEIKKSSQSQASNSQPKIPARDSGIIEYSPPKGEISPKKLLTDGTPWGKLLDKQKLKVSEELSRSLPSHYKEAAENFTKRLAERK